MDDSYARSTTEVLKYFGVTQEGGYSEDGYARALAQYGRNELPQAKGKSFLALVLKQFEDLLVIILLGAAVVSFVLGFLEDSDSLFKAFVEPAVILLILIANAIVGVIQETNAENAIAKLKEYEAREATVIRSGELKTVDSATLVPGDVIRIAVGAKVPADCRLVDLTSASMTVDESMLTGEPIPVIKQLEPIKMENPVNQDKINMLFSGTLVVRGRAKAVVVETGAKTELGKIQANLQEDDDEERTPLQEKLDVFASQLSIVILIICIVVWVINIRHFTDPEHGSMFKGAIYYFKIAVALAVAAIPEGLPAVVTTCLALGTMKMASKNAIVRSLPSVETLGCTTIICTDKTGTVTTNKMSVRRVMVLDNVGDQLPVRKVYEVEGDDFRPYGAIREEKSKKEVDLPAKDGALALIGRISSLCNESHLTFSRKTTDGRTENDFGHTGEATEAALAVLSEKIGVPDLDKCKDIFASRLHEERISSCRNFWEGVFPRIRLLDFNRKRKSMSVLSVDKETQQRVLHVKGAPESILSRCDYYITSDGTVAPLTDEVHRYINDCAEAFASEGLRVLGLSYLDDPSEDFNYGDMDTYTKIESKMTFVGLTGMLDPPRKEVRESIRKCNEAGIRVVVITGDNRATAEAICRDIGVFEQKENVKGKSFGGSEFMEMEEEQQLEVVKEASLFSRVEPNHKLRIVKLLKDHDEVVAMTGDGVNDAPALHRADIGVGMGTGTAVAREASDMILQDDNFATIVMAVEEGRAIYANTKQFIRYLISSNIGEVACIFLTAAIGMPEALIPVQLLWVNLVTDGLPATALGFNRPDADIMRQRPRGREEKIIDGWMFFRYFTIGLYIGLGTVAGFIWWFLFYENGPQISFDQLRNFHACETNTELFGENFNCAIFQDVSVPSTISLSILVTIEMFNTFNALSENQSLLVTPPWDNIWVVLAVILSIGLHCVILYVPWLTEVFSTAPINAEEWLAVLIISFPVILLDEVLKFITRQYYTRTKLSLMAQPKDKNL